ncbi:double-cubane-cluster-containing anaerobic reductase [Methanorbis furvi]
MFNLPPGFESFSESRKTAFLEAQKISETQPIVGTFCTFVPRELILAAGAAPISLCSGNDETIAAAEADLPINFCPLVKSSYGFAKTGKCPHFHFARLIVGETTCDGKKKMFEYMVRDKPVHVIHLPQMTDEESVAFLANEFRKFARRLEEIFSVTITDEMVAEQITLVNEERRALQDVYRLAKSDPPLLSGKELFVMFNTFTTSVGHEAKIAFARSLKEEYSSRPAGAGPRPKRILLTGSPITKATVKVIDAIESAGGSVVYIEGCVGSRPNELLVDEKNPDVYDALARKYIRIACSCMTPNDGRLQTIGEKIDEYHIDGVVDMGLVACHTFNAESTLLREYVTKTKSTPFIHVETDYSQADFGQLSTRLSAFLEML